MKVDTLPNGRQLTYGAYKDCSRPLRRCLKQLGSGSIEGGFNAIKTDSKALEEVAAVVDIDKQVSFKQCWTDVCILSQQTCLQHAESDSTLLCELNLTVLENWASTLASNYCNCQYCKAFLFASLLNVSCCISTTQKTLF